MCGSPETSLLAFMGGAVMSVLSVPKCIPGLFCECENNVWLSTSYTVVAMTGKG